MSGTEFTPGQQIDVSITGPKELEGQACYVIAEVSGQLTVLTQDVVSARGDCPLAFVPTGNATIRAAVAPQSGVPLPPSDLMDFVALSSSVSITEAK
ncbi:MAG: hypothetical protein WCP28_21825 [Actinomycetes bacterium]